MNIIQIFQRAVSRHGERMFAFDRTESVTYAQADERSDAIASAFVEQDICAGETVALAASDSVALWLTIIGAWKAGALPGLIDARTPEDELPYFVGDIDAKLTVAAPSLHLALKEAGAAKVTSFDAFLTSYKETAVNLHGPESPLYLSYTSGTTGPPKGVVLSSEPVTLGTGCIADRLRLTHKDVLLATTPTSSSFQLVAALMPALHVGAAIGLVAGSTAEETWRTARERQATVLVAYPLTLSDMVNAPEALEGDSPFRLALSGGSPLAPRIKRDYREQLGIPLLESYGQSELGGFMAMGAPHDDWERTLDGYVGRPFPDRLSYIGASDASENEVGKVGEVMVTHGYFVEYRNKAEKTAKTKQHDVLHTGDLGVADKDDYIKVWGRVQEADSARERRGFLREIEDALYEHEEVKHAAVVEDVNGNIRAYAELLEGRDATGDELQTFLAGRVKHSLVPEETVVLDQMPRSFSGKADRFTLSERV